MLPSVVARQVRETILDYLATTFGLTEADGRSPLLEFLDGPDGMFRGPYLDVRLPFRLADEDASAPLEIAPSFRPYRHQFRAFERLYSGRGHQPQHTLITTGTGSGKTECFLYPILDDCYRRQGEPGIKAIVLYPMNALATDQARRLAEQIHRDERLRGKVTAGLYVGGKGTHGAMSADAIVDLRDVLRASPPDVLLTNYKMLDFLLVRPDDARLWRHNGPETLRYLVLDELHTYDGAQGADVACLIRRLESRLGCAPGSVCCVGTSATIASAGAGARGGSAALTKFAGQLFEEYFQSDSVIGEDRLGADEALGRVADLDRIPDPSEAAQLAPDAFDSAGDWLRRQAELWLGDGLPRESPAFELELGRRLARHEVLRQILRTVERGARPVEDVDRDLVRWFERWEELEARDRGRALDSFVALVSAARRLDESGEQPQVRPFLGVQVHLWLRELRRLVRSPLRPAGSAPPRFRWLSEGDEPGGKAPWFQIVHCRDCGAHGIGALLPEGGDRLEADPEKVALAWLDKHRSCRAVFVAGESGGSAERGGASERGGGSSGERGSTGTLPRYFCPRCSKLTATPRCVSCDGAEPRVEDVEVDAEDATVERDERGVVEVLVSDELSGATPPKFLARCPVCGSDDSLGILGSRAASLLSVAVSQLFLSEHNDDRKLLAFTDSVQDASHRSMFFGARTYTFSLRTAIQGALEAAPDDVPVAELADRILDHWRERMPEDRLLAALLPPDLRELPEYRAFLENPREPHPDYVDALRQRLGWEITLEYGLNSRVGRTLESSLCSTVSPDREALRAASAELALIEAEEGFFTTPPLARPGAEAWEHLLAGLLRRARLRGALHHPLLDKYIAGNGAWYHLSRQRNRLVSPFYRDSVLPRLLVDREHKVFDSVVSPSSSLTWVRDWAERVLGVDRRDPGIDALYREALRRLTKAGLLAAYPIGRGATAWALEPRRHLARRAIATVACDACRREVVVGASEVEAWAGRPCPHYRCRGRLRALLGKPATYYSRIYRSGRIERIYCAEHTGLLQRADREALEQRFKDGDAPDAPNLIVCTPTLEMGIDIGDLSATVLCAVPPTPANYLQRLGRAGRKTGNAVSVTMAVHRPHDLYFHAQPLEMLAGQVLPPGAFLDAPEMLKRQLVAFGMDRWARDAAVQMPSKMRFVWGALGRSQFPGPFLAFWREQRDALVESFLARFRDVLSERNAQRLRELAAGDAVPELIEAAFDASKKERDELLRIHRRTNERLAAIERDPSIVEDDPEAEKEELRATQKVLGRLLDELGNRYPLEVLTDAGVLPNYAFPEQGVRLQAVLTERDGKGGNRYETVEYVRPASRAIRELAPFNTFYAEGRSVQVDEIDIGSKAQPLLEHWRFCPRCCHAERELDDASRQGGGTVATECPRCGDARWSDAGQRRVMVPFRRSRALTSRLEAAARGTREQREQERYGLRDLIDVGEENRAGARLIEDLPFGYELLRDLELLEVNFGVGDRAYGKTLDVAGRPVAERGFDVCLDCGRVQKGPPDGERAFLRHAPYCRARREGATERTEPVFLYRRLRSEALRVLLPVVAMELDRKRASFKAALELGFRRHFQGNPDHLQIKVTDEPTSTGSGRRQYVLVYDTVPGGTGYLSQLWQGDTFLEVLEAALRALESCDCQRSDRGPDDGPVRDGCYRCLYAYQVQRDLPLISSREAQRMLREILSRRGEFREVLTLSDVSIEALVESELELRFLVELEAWSSRTEGAKWEQRIQDGKARWLLTLPGGRAWEVTPQVELGSKQGVIEASRADFLLRPLGGDPAVRPVAVYCDGFAYHAFPGEARGRIGDDVRKRQSILDAGAAVVWSIGHDDLEDFRKSALAPPGSLARSLDAKTLKATAQETGLAGDPGRLRRSSVQLLLDYLADSELEAWARASRTAALAWVLTGPFVADDVVDVFEAGLQEDPDRCRLGPVAVNGVPNPGDQVWSRVSDAGELAIVGRIRAEDAKASRFEETVLVQRLFDHAEARAEAGFVASWRAFLHNWNLLQFHARLRVVTSELLQSDWKVVYEPPTEEQASQAAEPPGAHELRERLELATAEARPLIEAVWKAGLPLPEIAFELEIGRGAGPEAELAWPEAKLAVLAGQQTLDREAFERAGWTVLEMPIEAQALVETLQERWATAAAGGSETS